MPAAVVVGDAQPGKAMPLGQRRPSVQTMHWLEHRDSSEGSQAPMAGNGPPHGNSYCYASARSNSMSHAMGSRGMGSPGTRFPNPASAYGHLSYPTPHSAQGMGFGRTSGQFVNPAGALAVSYKATGKGHRPLDTSQPGGVAKHPRLDPSLDHHSRRSLWAPSAEVPTSGDVHSRSARSAYVHGGDVRYQPRSRGQVSPRMTSPPAGPSAASAGSAGTSGKPHPSPSPSLGGPAERFSASARGASPRSPPVPPHAKVQPVEWKAIEAAGRRNLGESQAKRRAKAIKTSEEVSTFRGCPVESCPMGASEVMGAGWMTRHLAGHMQLAAEKQVDEAYITSTVATVLHDICLDLEVPPNQRKFERQRMSRDLLKPPKGGIGITLAVMETKVTGDCQDPRVRRCALDLATGGCLGLDRPEAIKRCDKCRAWYHISCGQMGMGRGLSGTDNVDEVLCRECSRMVVGAMGKDLGVLAQRQAALLRVKRRQMLSFLEEEVDSGWPEGVFDLNISAEDGATRNARGRNGKTRRRGADNEQQKWTANAKNARREIGGGASAGAKAREVERPACAAIDCAQLSRPDSRFCCDGCGVRNAQRLLTEALRHSLEERLGLERGRKLAEIRELKARKNEVVTAMKKLAQPRAPAFKVQQEASLRSMVERRRRLWKRLIEIGAYWEKVSGSKTLSSAASAAQAQAAAAAAASASQSAAARQRQSPAGAAGGPATALSDLSSPRSEQSVDVGGSEAGDKTPRGAGKPQGAGRTGGVGNGALAQSSRAAGQTERTATGSGVANMDVDKEHAGGACSEASALANGQADSGRVQAVQVIPEAAGASGEQSLAGYGRTRPGGIPDTSPSTRPQGTVPLAATPLPSPVRATPPSSRAGVEHMTCIYCGEESGPDVMEHLEECYRQVAALRNQRLDSATLRPLVDSRGTLPGGAPPCARRITSSAPTTTLDFSGTIGRQLLSRRICYADFNALPDPAQFQLHQDLEGWMTSPSRLDFLYKELVRQRNAAIHELQALDRDEAALEVFLRHDWMKDGLRSVPRGY